MVDNILSNGTKVLFTRIEPTLTPVAIEEGNVTLNFTNTDDDVIQPIKFTTEDANANDLYFTTVITTTALTITCHKDNDASVDTDYDAVTASLTTSSADWNTILGVGTTGITEVANDGDSVSTIYLKGYAYGNGSNPVIKMITEDKDPDISGFTFDTTETPTGKFTGAEFTYSDLSASNELFGIDLTSTNDIEDAVTLICNHFDYDFANVFIPGLNYDEHKTYINNYAGIITSEYNGNAMLVVDLVPAKVTTINIYDSTKTGNVHDDFTYDPATVVNAENVSIYYPPILMNNLEDEEQYYPASMYVAGLYSTVESINMPWQVISGINRAQLSGNITLSRKLNKNEMGALYYRNINPIISYVTQTDQPVVWGQKTTIVDGTALSRINVAKLMIYLKKIFLSTGDSFAFEYNDAITRTSLTKQISAILSNVKQLRGLNNYEIKCDGENNTSTIIDRNQLIAEVWVQPSRSAEFIYIPVTIEKTESTS